MAERTSPEEVKLQELVDLAMEKGSYKAKIISPTLITVEERAQLKCFIPRCVCYNEFLTCPPNVPSPERVRRMLGEYRVAIMVQVRGSEEEDGDDDRHYAEDYEMFMKWVYPSVQRLHQLVDQLEIRAFDLGFYFAMGLSGGECRWCKILDDDDSECGGKSTGQCRQHYKARPAMEAMSINVLKTAENAGMPFHFSGKDERYVIWNGVVLLD